MCNFDVEVFTFSRVGKRFDPQKNRLTGGFFEEQAVNNQRCIEPFEIQENICAPIGDSKGTQSLWPPEANFEYNIVKLTRLKFTTKEDDSVQRKEIWCGRCGAVS